MYWLSGEPVKRMYPVVSAALVENGSVTSVPGGKVPDTTNTWILIIRPPGYDPSQSCTWILTGMVLLYLNTLLPSCLIGGRMPPPTMVKFSVNVALIDAEVPPSSSEMVTLA